MALARSLINNYFKAPLRFRSNIKFPLSGTGAPTDAVTGAGTAGPGSFYVRTSNGAVYVNTNTKASPTWSQLGSVAALTSAHIFVGNGANAGTDVALSGDATLDNTGALTVAPALIQHTTKALTAAQIKGFKTTPIQVLATPGANKAVVVHGAMFNLIYGTTQMAAGGVVSLIDAGGHNSVCVGGVPAATLQAAASSSTWLGPLVTATGNARPANTAVNIEAATADFTTGDSTAVVHLWYSVVPSNA